jgi:hypothetical protein
MAAVGAAAALDGVGPDLNHRSINRSAVIDGPDLNYHPLDRPAVIDGPDQNHRPLDRPAVIDLANLDHCAVLHTVLQRAYPCRGGHAREVFVDLAAVPAVGRREAMCARAALGWGLGLLGLGLGLLQLPVAVAPPPPAAAAARQLVVALGDSVEVVLAAGADVSTSSLLPSLREMVCPIRYLAAGADVAVLRPIFALRPEAARGAAVGAPG